MTWFCLKKPLNMLTYLEQHYFNNLVQSKQKYLHIKKHPFLHMKEMKLLNCDIDIM